MSIKTKKGKAPLVSEGVPAGSVLKVTRVSQVSVLRIFLICKGGKWEGKKWDGRRSLREKLARGKWP